MSLDFDDDAYLPPATGGMAKADTPKQAVNPEEEAKASFTNGETTVNTDGTAKEASQEEKGNIHSSDWVGGFEDDVTPPKPPTIIAPEVARLNTPITPFNQQQLRVGKTIEGLNKETASFDELMGGIRDDLTKESFISLVAQGQADNANSYVSYHFDAEINKHNPAFKRFEKDNGHAKYTQLFVNVEVVENPNTDGEVKRPYRKFQTDQEGFGYYYPDLAKYALKRKVITEEIEADTTHGKERAPLLTRLGDPETYIDYDGNTLSIEDRRAKAFELATGVNKKRTFEITVKDYINSISNEAKYTWTDLNLKGTELPTALNIEEPVKDDPAKIDVLANPSHEYTYQVYRPVAYMPTTAEVLALTKDMSATIRITYEPKLAKEVSAHEHLVRSLSSEGIRSYKDISIRGLQKLDTPDNGNDMKARLTLTDSEGHVKDDVLVTYKRTEPKTGPYVDVIQGSLTKKELSADGLQHVSPSINDPKYQLLKDGKEGKVVLSKKVLKYEQNARKNHRMFSYNGLTAYPEVLTNMSKEILPFVFKDLVPGHYSIESTMDEIKASGKVKVKAVESSPLYTGEVESPVKVFSPSEHMLNSVLTGFANTDAIFKDSVVEAMARDDWEKRFDIGTVGISGYGFSPYKLLQGDKGQKTADLQYFLHDIPLNYHYLRRYNEFFAHPSVNSPMGTNEKEAEQLSHIGRFASPNFARLTWGIQHSQLLNQTPFYYRKRAKDSFKQALFNNLVREKKLTPDWTYRVSDEGLITGYIDNNEPGVKYKNDIVMDAWHPQFLYRKGGLYDTVAMTRSLHPNGLIYHYPNISSKYEQDDIRFASQSAYAMTRDGTALHDNRVRNADASKDAYPHPFDTSNRTNNTRYDWMLSDVYLKAGTLVDVLDYINSAQERYKRYRTVFNKSDNTTEFTGKNSFLAKASKSLYDRVQGQTGELPESVVEKVFSNRAFNTVSSPFGDNLITVRDEKAGKVVLAPSAVLADPNIYIPYGMSSYAFQAANKDDTDAQYIQYLLNRGQTNRYLADHTYLADYLKEKAYQALPKTILINETPEAGDFALEALPNMAFYRSKVNYASGNQLNKFQLFNFEKGNNVGKDNITPVKVGKVKVITQDTDEHLNAKFNMGYVKPHIAESLAISLKERRDYGINGLHASATGIYKPYPYHTSSVFDGYKVQHPQKGDNAFGELNISITENEFFNLYHEVFPTVTITPNVEGVMEDSNAPQQNPVTITYSDGKENHKPDIDYLEKILTKLVARYVTDTTGWKESDFEVTLGKDEDTAALGSFALPADVAKLNTKETLITKFLKPLYTKFKEATNVGGGGHMGHSYYSPMRTNRGDQHGYEVPVESFAQSVIGTSKIPDGKEGNPWQLFTWMKYGENWLEALRKEIIRDGKLGDYFPGKSDTEVLALTEITEGDRVYLYQQVVYANIYAYEHPRYDFSGAWKPLSELIPGSQSTYATVQIWDEFWNNTFTIAELTKWNKPESQLKTEYTLVYAPSTLANAIRNSYDFNPEDDFFKRNGQFNPWVYLITYMGWDNFTGNYILSSDTPLTDVSMVTVLKEIYKRDNPTDDFDWDTIGWGGTSTLGEALRGHKFSDLFKKVFGSGTKYNVPDTEFDWLDEKFAESVANESMYYGLLYGDVFQQHVMNSALYDEQIYFQGTAAAAPNSYFDQFLYKANNVKSPLMTKEESDKAAAAEKAKQEAMPDNLQLESVLFDLDSIRLNTPITQLTNFYVKVKVTNPEYLYGTLHANVSFSIADSQLNLGRESLITGITLNDFNTNMSAVTAFSNSNFSDISASRLGYNVHFGDLKFGDSNASPSPNAPTGLHSRETFKVLRHLATQVNPHSDIFADYDLAATSPIYADLSEMRKVFNYNDGSLDESLKDPLVPASLHRYLSPEVKQYLRLRGFELMAEGKLNNVYYYANEIPVAYHDARYIGLAHSTPAYNAIVTGTAYHETAGTKAKFIRRSMNRYGVAMANNDLMKTNPDSYFKEALYTQLPGENLYDNYFATQHDAWKYYYGFFHSLPVVEAPFYRYTNHAGGRVIEKNVTYTDEHQQALGYYQGRDMKPGSLITQRPTAKYEYTPVKQTTRLSTDYRPGIKVGMKYPYIAKFNDAVNVTYYLDHKRVDPAEVEKLKEITDTTLKLDPETLVSGLNVVAVWHKGQDPYYYDNNQLSILDYLDAVRYGHFDYQTGEIKDMLFSHNSMKAIMENIGRYGIKTKAVDESVLHSKHTVEFFENKFMYFLKHIGYFFVSKFYDTRHLWSGVQTYTQPEETFEAWGLKSNALVWFDLPEYMKLFKRVFSFNFGSADTMALSKAICPDGANNNGYIFHLMWNMEESDNGTKWQLHHPRVSPVALLYTRRPTPSFDYKVTVGMNTYQAKYLAEHPDDLTRNPGRYKDVWSTFEIPTNLGKADGKPVLAGFQGMITPLIKQKWYHPEGDNSESFLLQNLTKEESLKYWPNIDDNYEFDKFKSSLDWFGHDRMVMINKHDYTKLVTDEDLLFVTNRDDAKRIMLIGTNSRTNFLSQVVRYSEQNTDKSVEKVDEVVLAKAMLKANGKLNTEFKLIPSANHPLYFGEATVTYSTFGSGDGPNIIRGYADEIWLNTTMLDYRRFLAEDKLRIETVRPDYARMSPIIEENPDFVGERDHPIHRYRHISDHALPWLFPGLFIAEEVNYKALVKHIEYLNEHFKNEDGSEKWSMDFLKFINPGYRTAGIPFVTLNHRELAELTGYRLQRLPTTIIPGTHKYKRGQTVHWNLNNLIGKFEGDDLYALLKAREGGNVIGKLTPIPNPYPDAWRKYFKDEAGQVFEAYDDGSLKLMSTSTKFLQQRQVANATRTPYTANLGVRKYGRLFETEDQANTQYFHMEGHTLLANLERYSDDEIINRVTRAKELGLDFTRALGGLSNEVSPRLNSRIEQLHNHFAEHFINKHVQLADYGIDMPIEPMAVDLDADSKERALMVTPALLGKHNYVTLKDYRYTVTVPGAFNDSYDTITYRLSDNFIDSLFTGKRVNKMFEVVEEIKNHELFEKGLGKGGIELGQMQEIQDGIIHAKLPVDTGVAYMGIVTESINRNQLSEEYRKAFGEELRSEYSYEKVQLATAYPSLMSPETDDAEYESLKKRIRGVGMLPFQTPSNIMGTSNDDDDSDARGYAKGNYKVARSTLGKKTYIQPLSARGFAQELTYTYMKVGAQQNLIIGGHVDEKSLRDDIVNQYQSNGRVTRYPIHGLEVSIQNELPAEKRMTWETVPEKTESQN